MKLKQLQKVDLPREKLAKYGVDKLKDYELLALLLGSGIKGLNVLELSKRILILVKKDGIGNITLKNLLEIKGLGKAKASQVLSALELSKRLNTENQIEILSSLDVWNFCSDIRSTKREHFIAFYLDTQNRLIERQIISIGTLNASLVHPREVFEPALTLHASSILIAHNHPSGELNPSADDIEVTRRLVQSGKIIGVEIVDHIIVTKNSYLSFQQKNLL
ncbi:MAG: DNA repair protein RadC [Candidatus Pacebacteria bacterium]|nr:DNA repair protein RadC [Candidatus Paceibacterota bacterium]